MLHLPLEIPLLHLERARECEGCSETAWCTNYWQGEFLGRRWLWKELKETNKHPSCPKYTKTAPNTGGPALIGLKIAKNAFM